MYKEKFPIFKNNPRLVYLDSAASAQVPESVINAMDDYYRNYKANVHRGIYTLSEKATDEYELARRKVANFINADEKEIVFTGGLTDAMNGLASSLSNEMNMGDIIVTTNSEHHSSFLPFQRIANQKKINLKYVNLNDDFTLNLNHLDKLLSLKPKYLVISGLSNVTGYIAPLKNIIEKAHSRSCRVIVDAAQLAPHKVIDVKELDVDYLVLAGHKLYGPTGIGVLYGKRELLSKLDPIKVGGGMIEFVEKNKSTWAELPERHEAGTPNIAGAIGLAAAVEFLQKIGIEDIEKHEKEITEYTIKELKKIDGLKVFTPNDPELRSSVISIHLDKAHSHDIADILDRHKVAVRAGHHCAQILLRENLKVEATARVSIGIYNDKNDVDKLIEALAEVNRIFD